MSGENVPGIPGACATRNVTYLVRGPWHTRLQLNQSVFNFWKFWYSSCIHNPAYFDQNRYACLIRFVVSVCWIPGWQINHSMTSLRWWQFDQMVLSLSHKPNVCDDNISTNNHLITNMYMPRLRRGMIMIYSHTRLHLPVAFSGISSYTDMGILNCCLWTPIVIVRFVYLFLNATINIYICLHFDMGIFFYDCYGDNPFSQRQVLGAYPYGRDVARVTMMDLPKWWLVFIETRIQLCIGFNQLSAKHGQNLISVFGCLST